MDSPPGGSLGLGFAAWLENCFCFQDFPAVPNGAKMGMSRGMEGKAGRAGNVQPGQEELWAEP